jgi:hypothetical protein
VESSASHVWPKTGQTWGTNLFCLFKTWATSQTWGTSAFSYLKSERPAPLLVTFGGVYVMEWAGVLRFAQDDTSNKIKIKSKAF